MTLRKQAFSFLLGTAVGTYLGQNNYVPNLKVLAGSAMVIFQHKFGKPEGRRDDDGQWGLAQGTKETQLYSSADNPPSEANFEVPHTTKE